MTAFERFQQERLNLTVNRFTHDNEKELAVLCDQFDCFVCGSDQIWNLDCTDGPVAPFFLSFAGDKRRIAYAPSLAHTSFRAENFTESDKKFIGGELDRFFALSVRESATVSLFQPLTRNTIEVCLDPTLLLDAEDYKEITNEAIVPEEKYVFVYMLEHNDELNRQAEHVARGLNAGIYYVSKWDQRFCVDAKNCYGIGPEEFLGLLKNASAVVTNSFHATVFSLLFGVPFQTIATRQSGSRMQELLDNLGESQHLIMGESSELPTAADRESLRSALGGLRHASMAFLHNALRS